jgi:hypothetical protein
MNTHQHSENSQEEKPLPVKRNPLSATDFSEADRKRFWAKARKGNPDECWEWTANLNEHGYGRFMLNKIVRLAHRVSFTLVAGEIPNDMQCCHRCDNPKCVNPEHLFLGTHTENMRDCSKKNRNWNLKKTHCCKGHAFTSENTYINTHGNRSCRECGRKFAREYARKLSKNRNEKCITTTN